MRSKLLQTVRWSETRGELIANDGNALTSAELRRVADAANAFPALLAACQQLVTIESNKRKVCYYCATQPCAPQCPVDMAREALALAKERP